MGDLLFRFLFGLEYAEKRNKRDQFYKLVILLFIRTVVVAEVESGSDFRETCLAIKVLKEFV